MVFRVLCERLNVAEGQFFIVGVTNIEQERRIFEVGKMLYCTKFLYHYFDIMFFIVHIKKSTKKEKSSESNNGKNERGYRVSNIGRGG